MNLKGKKVGVGITGSFCTINSVIPVLKELKEKGADIHPFISSGIEKFDTRFAIAKEFIAEVEEICEKKVISDVVGAEVYGAKKPLDIMLLFPLTGGSLAKFANGINDNAPLLAAKATLRNLTPVVIALYTNDGLGMSGVNIFKLVNTKNVFMVPFGQDDYINKPNSITSNVELVVPTVEKALDKEQIQPVIIENFNK